MQRIGGGIVESLRPPMLQPAGKRGPASGDSCYLFRLMTPCLKAARIILLCTLAACLYGVVQDQVAVRLCLEYFTVAHPPLFHTTSPNLPALCWGVAATAAIGALFGIVLARVSQSPGSTPYPLSRLGRSIIVLLAVTGGAALLSVGGYRLSRSGFVSQPSAWERSFPGSSTTASWQFGLRMARVIWSAWRAARSSAFASGERAAGLR